MVPEGGVLPAVSASFSGSTLQAYVELFSEAPEQLEKASVVMEVAEREDGPTLDAAAASLKQPGAVGSERRTAEAGVPIALRRRATSGARGGQRLGPEGRSGHTPFRTCAPQQPLPRRLRARAGNGAADRVSSRMESFERGSVVTRRWWVLLDRMNVGNRWRARPRRRCRQPGRQLRGHAEV